MHSVPRPGPVHGLYPQRPEAALHAGSTGMQRLVVKLRGLVPGRQPMVDLLREVRASQAVWRQVAERNWPAHLQRLRARLGREAWQNPALRVQALGCVAARAQRCLGRDPFDTQLACADLLLQGCLAEMATGEGKTLAVGLAAAVAALAGAPVHVMTANDYLAQRDAEQLAPLYRGLGLRHAVVLASSTPQQRRLAYAADITYATAREVAFDHLRDRQHLQTMPTALQQRAARLMAGDAAAEDAALAVARTVRGPGRRGRQPAH
jgi:preprotein translocase subunit SecA